MNMKGLYLILLSFLFGCNLPDMQTGKEVSYYFDQPAQIWEETLPLGNGRIGMMPDGGIERENVVLNEISCGPEVSKIRTILMRITLWRIFVASYLRDGMTRHRI